MTDNPRKPKERNIFHLSDFAIPAEDIEIGQTLNQLDQTTGEVLEQWRWNGGKWLGKLKNRDFNISDIRNDRLVPLSVDREHDLHLINLKIDYHVNGRNDDRRYWDFELYRMDKLGDSTLIANADTQSGNVNSLLIDLNLEDRVVHNQTLYYMLELDRQRTPGVLGISGNLIYRYCKNHDTTN